MINIGKCQIYIEYEIIPINLIGLKESILNKKVSRSFINKIMQTHVKGSKVQNDGCILISAIKKIYVSKKIKEINDINDFKYINLFELFF